MLIRFLRGTALGGVGNDAHPGDVLDLPHKQAAALIAQGRAELAEAASEAADPQRKPNRKAK